MNGIGVKVNENQGAEKRNRSFGADRENICNKFQHNSEDGQGYEKPITPVQ